MKMLCLKLLMLTLLNGAVLARTPSVPDWYLEAFPELKISPGDVRYSFNPETMIELIDNDGTQLEDMEGAIGVATSKKNKLARNAQPDSIIRNSRNRKRRASNIHETAVKGQVKKTVVSPKHSFDKRFGIPDVDAIVNQHFGAGEFTSSYESFDPDTLEDFISSEEVISQYGSMDESSRSQGKGKSRRHVSTTEVGTEPPPETSLSPLVNKSAAPPRPGLRPIQPYSPHGFEPDAEWVPKDTLKQDIFVENTPTDPLYREFLPLNSRYTSRLEVEDDSIDGLRESQLPPDYGQRIPDFSLYDRPDLDQMRQIGPLCGVFVNPLFHSELRAVNQSTFILRNTYVHTGANFNSLTVTFRGATNSTSQVLLIKPGQKLMLHNFEFLLDSHMDIQELRKVEIMDNSKTFTVDLNVSRCIVPRPWSAPGLAQPQNGLHSEYIILYTSNVLVIGGFSYPATCPAASFWAGRTNNPSNGFPIPTLDGSREPLRRYHNEEVWLQLPNGFTFYDLDYIGVFCPLPRQMLGVLYLRRSAWKRHVLPPATLSDERLKLKHASSLH